MQYVLSYNRLLDYLSVAVYPWLYRPFTLLAQKTLNSRVTQLIPAVVSYLREKDCSVTKTRLIKLLYLFDVEYYRRHRETFTGFPWKYFHLGPWVKECDSLIGDLVSEGVLIENPSKNIEYDTKFYDTEEQIDLERVLSDFNDEMVLRGVLNTWGERPLGELLDYIYFRTEPMEHGIRNEPLDFAKIRETAPPRYSRSSSEQTAKVMTALKKQFRERKAKLYEKKKEFSFTPPRYDEEFFEAIEKLDRATQ